MRALVDQKSETGSYFYVSAAYLLNSLHCSTEDSECFINDFKATALPSPKGRDFTARSNEQKGIGASRQDRR